MIAYLQKKNGKILFTGTYMEVYIPEKLFKKSLNEFLGDRANIYGIFNFRIGDKNGNITESSTLHTFNLPAMFITRPSSTEIKTMQLKKEFDEEKYVIFKYYTGDELMVSDKTIQDVTNVEKFINLILSAHLPRTIKYEDVLRLFYKCMEINSQDGAVTGIVYSIMIAEMYRSKNDSSLPFRKEIGKNDSKVSQYDYIPIKVRNVAANNSTFGALTFEDINTMVAYSVNRSREHKKQNISPLEKIIHV